MNDTPRTDDLAVRIDAMLKSAWKDGFDAESIDDADYTDERTLAIEIIEETMGTMERELTEARTALDVIDMAVTYGEVRGVMRRWRKRAGLENDSAQTT